MTMGRISGSVLYNVIEYYYRNKGDRDLVWTFGGGPRVCIGRFLIEVILKVHTGRTMKQPFLMLLTYLLFVYEGMVKGVAGNS